MPKTKTRSERRSGFGDGNGKNLRRESAATPGAQAAKKKPNRPDLEVAASASIR